MANPIGTRTLHRLALPVGSDVEGYRIVSVLGQGGFGITYLADYDPLARKVALKELLPTAFATRGEGLEVVPLGPESVGDLTWCKDRFLEEARRVARCEHPNVLKVYDVFEANGTAYMATGYEPGQTLHAWIDALGRPPTEDEVMAILLPLLDGLEHVHGQTLLHRDIKPDNIWIRADGRPLLLDFGAAREAIGSRSCSMTSLVSSGYTPLEQYSSDDASHVTAATDLYALAATFYRVLTGEKPPESPRRVRNDTCVKLVERLQGRYSATLLAALDQCLAVADTERPGTVAAFRGLLLGDDARTTLRPRPPALAAVVVAAKPTPSSLTIVVVIGAALMMLGVLGGGFLFVDPLHLWRPKGGDDSVKPGSASPGESPAPSKPRPKQDPDPTPRPPVLPPVVSPRPAPTPAPPVQPRPPAATPSTADRGTPFVNSLGMSFIPIPITGGPSGATRVLFCVHETRFEDYQVFADDQRGAGSAWRNTVYENTRISGSTGEAHHPVVNVAWEDLTTDVPEQPSVATFCGWLTLREQKAGKIGSRDYYRLPTDHEWSCAANIGRETADALPASKSGGILAVFPWGGGLDPQEIQGNYADTAFTQAGLRKLSGGAIDGYTDGFATTAPVMHFAANKLGLFDLGGNVAEWCQDWRDDTRSTRVVRGASWMDHGALVLVSSARPVPPRTIPRMYGVGFRCVLVAASSKP